MSEERPILVVEDDPSVREYLCSLLEMEGYPVMSAANGQAALKVMAVQRPSLVLLDMHMPILDGWGFAAEVERRGWDPPILVVTATARDAPLRAVEVGAVGYVPKPCDPDEILQAIDRYRIP
jgi:two-component system, chemotaxis family, chemotaxis protein CheY